MLYFNYNYQLNAAFLFEESDMQQMKSRMSGNRWAVAIVAVAALLLAKPIFAQEVSETRLADGVYMLEGQGGNMMLVTTESHTVLVDAQFARMAEAIGAKIEALDGLPLSYLINTHFHGDLFFVDRFPFVDLNAGGTVQGYIDAINAVLADANEHTQIIPGHGPLSNVADYARLRDMMIETREQVRAWHAAGADVETMVATGLDEKWADWTWNFINEERWIRTLYNDLQAVH